MTYCETIEIDISDSCITLSNAHHTARKDHKCSECHKIISKGTTYLKETVIYDSIQTYKICNCCESIRSIFFTEGWHYGQLMNMLHDHISDCETISESVILKLIPEAQTLILKIMENK